ncbi:CGNR zinc finger domain-containing protein [Streptomyces hydrogenans]|uniref:CGNR zinc finger domain-containing protein n=1 Tax=Streptomyces hydrogenans TaxID=1873719 RepID=UPI00365E3061
MSSTADAVQGQGQGRRPTCHGLPLLPRAHEIAGASGLFLDTSRGTNRRWCSKNTRGNKVKKARLARTGPVAALRSRRPFPCRPGAPARSVGRPAEGRSPFAGGARPRC